MVVQIPLDCLFDAGFKCDLWGVAKLCGYFSGVDGIAAVVAFIPLCGLVQAGFYNNLTWKRGRPARCNDAGGTPTFPDIAKWASYLRPVPYVHDQPCILPGSVSFIRKVMSPDWAIEYGSRLFWASL